MCLCQQVAPATPRSKKKADGEEAAPQLSQSRPALSPLEKHLWLQPRFLPTETEEPLAPAEVDMRRYRNLLDQVPPESCSVGLILHCMLEQVCV